MEGKSRESQETLSYRDQNTQIHVTRLMFSLKTIMKKKNYYEEILVDVLLIETERGPLPHALQKSTVVCSTGQSRTHKEYSVPREPPTSPQAGRLPSQTLAQRLLYWGS